MGPNPAVPTGSDLRNVDRFFATRSLCTNGYSNPAHDLSSAMSAELELIAAGYPAASADSARAASRLAPKLAYD